MVIDFNYYNPIKGDGAGIFLHIAREDGSGTAGCIAMWQEDLLNIMKRLDPTKNPRIIITVEDELNKF